MQAKNTYLLMILSIACNRKCIHVYIYIYIHIHICIYIYIQSQNISSVILYIYIYIQICTNLVQYRINRCNYSCIHFLMSQFMYLSIYSYTYLSIWNMHMMYIPICIYIGIYEYAYIHKYTCTY